MGMDLSGRGGYFRFNWTNWRRVLELAHRYGWVPAGTEPHNFAVLAPDGTVDEEETETFRHPNEDWDGTYFSNDRQWVTDGDAANIAQALVRADERDRENRRLLAAALERKDAILLNLTERIPELEAPSEVSASSEAVEDEPERAEEHRPATGEAQEGRPWWRRMFGG